MKTVVTEEFLNTVANAKLSNGVTYGEYLQDFPGSRDWLKETVLLEIQFLEELAEKGGGGEITPEIVGANLAGDAEAVLADLKKLLN